MRLIIPATKGLPLPQEAFSVRDAPPKGRGLFAARDIANGSYLFDYTGNIMRDAEYDGRSDYAVGIANAAGMQFVVDASDPLCGIHRFINHAPAGNTECNVVCLRAAYQLETKSISNAPPPRIHMFASRTIQTDEELCMDYGCEYWQGRSPGAIAFRQLSDMPRL